MIKKIKGTNDILPVGLGEGVFVSELWQNLEQKIREVARCYGYSECRTPIFETTELFVKGLGDVTDIVQKEMFSFEDRGERKLTLRPEGTAPVVRSYIENAIAKKESIARLFYMGPMFRAERPQKGRYRQFHQFGIEAIGSSAPQLDVEVIALFWTILSGVGLRQMELQINSVGCPECRPAYRAQLRDYFKDKLDQLCDDCKDRYDNNILRMLDCKVSGCQAVLDTAPSPIGSLCEGCATSYSAVKEGLAAISIPYLESHRLVRGLDYYTKTAFEIVHASIGAQATIVGGGRYDQLVEASGGPKAPAVGAAFGVERLLLSLAAEDSLPEIDRAPFFFLVLLDPEKEANMRQLLYSLRAAGIYVSCSDGSRQISKQLKAAARSMARYAVFVGGDEWEKGELVVKDLSCAEQQQLGFAETDVAQPLVGLYHRMSSV